MFEFDPELSTYVPSEQLAPTAFRVPQTIEQGRVAFRAGGSYFDLSQEFSPIAYRVDAADESFTAFVKLGLDANARVGVVSSWFAYGISDRIQLSVNIPGVFVDASASQFFTSSDATGPAAEAPLSGTATLETLDPALEQGLLTVREESFTNLGFDFNDGSHAGLGRVSTALKWLLWGNDRVQFAAETELYLPSPSEDEFAGSETFAITPRLIAQAVVLTPLRLHLDTGYDGDFEKAELRRFYWNAGASFATGAVSVDFGIGGSEFDSPIAWTPQTATSVETPEFPATFLTALEDNSVGTTFIDVLGGIKVRVSDGLLLSGGVSVPVNDEGFRPDAMFSLGLEVGLH